MANMKNGYKINWKTNTVTMTRSFTVKASVYGTDEYNMLLDLREKGFKMVLPVAKKRKACPTRVTFKKIEQLLSCMNDADERLAEFHATAEYAKGQKNPYEYVRQWFLLNYPNFREYQEMDTNYRIVAPKLHLLPEVKTEKSA